MPANLPIEAVPTRRPRRTLDSPGDGRWRLSRLLPYAAVLCGFAVSGCSSSSSLTAPPDAGSRATSTDAGSKGKPTEAGSMATPMEAGSTVSVVTGPSGGTVTGQGVMLDIPAGALTANQTITITATSDSPPPGVTALSPLFEFGPSGLTFQVPITVHFDLTSSGSNPVIMWSAATASGFASVATSVVGSVASGQVTHFSGGFVADEPRSCSVPAAPPCPACDTGPCTGATPFAYCVSGTEGHPGGCVTQPSCTCVAKSTCSAAGNGCGTDCSETCDASAPYAVCISGNGTTTLGQTQPTCTSMASCSCSTTQPGEADAGGVDAGGAGGTGAPDAG